MGKGLGTSVGLAMLDAGFIQEGHLYIHSRLVKGLDYDQTKFIGKWSLKTGDFCTGFDEREWSSVGNDRWLSKQVSKNHW